MSPTPEMEAQGGQRIANLLVYLNDLPEEDGGATVFKNLALRVRPRKVCVCARVFLCAFDSLRSNKQPNRTTGVVDKGTHGKTSKKPG